MMLICKFVGDINLLFVSLYGYKKKGCLFVALLALYHSRCTHVCVKSFAYKLKK